jgi:hypothetical protein
MIGAGNTIKKIEPDDVHASPVMIYTNPKGDKMLTPAARKDMENDATKKGGKKRRRKTYRKKRAYRKKRTYRRK